MRQTVFSRFARAKQGLAALEFAILAPMMVFVLFASIDLLDMLDTNNRLENAAVSLADVVARDTEVTDAEVDGFWQALDVLMFPNNGAVVDMRISSVSIEANGTARVIWSEGHGLAPRPGNSTLTLSEMSAGLRTPGTSVIMSEAEMEYNGPLSFLLAGAVTLSHDAYRRSRLIDPIPRG